MFVVFSNFYGVNTPIMTGFKLPMVDWLAKFLNIQQSALTSRYKPFQHTVGWRFDLTAMVMVSSPLDIIKKKFRGKGHLGSSVG